MRFVRVRLIQSKHFRSAPNRVSGHDNSLKLLLAESELRLDSQFVLAMDSLQFTVGAESAEASSRLALSSFRTAGGSLNFAGNVKASQK